MTRRRAGVATLAIALGLVLIGGATAGGAAQATPWSMLGHGGSAARYLSSIGVNPTGFVVQRGHRNYAGPKCPGKGWNCTKSHRVLQFTTAGGANSVTCTASGGGGPVTSSNTSSAQTCTIVQVSTSGQNTATCTEQASTTSSGTLSQDCSITQTSGSGASKATATQTLLQGASSCTPPSGTSTLQTQSGTQTASIVQSSSSGNGTASINQSASQCASTTTNGSAAQSQATSQTFTIQQGPVGFNPASLGNPPCPNTGSLTATATQAQHQRGYATTAVGGTQGQRADLVGHMDQCSSSHAQYTANQSEDQFLAPNSSVAQTQIGPTSLNGAPARTAAKRTLQKGVCCSFQGTNSSDTCTITQNTSQSANANAVQTEQLTTSAGTTGTCTGAISGNQNGTPFGSTQSGSNVDNTINCQSQVCTGALLPTTLTWSGDTSGIYHDPANLSATLTSNGTPVAGQIVQLTAGAESCSVATDANGVASCSPVLNDTPGAIQAGASFAATTIYAGSSVAPFGFTVNKAPTTLTYTGATFGNYHDTVTLSGTLVEGHHAGTPVVGRSVTFAVSGDPLQTCSTSTDSSGAASCQVKLTADPASFTVTAVFDGSSDPDYLSANAGTGFTIFKAPTTLTYANTGATSGNYHDTVTLTGQLTESDTGAAIAGKTVTLSVTPDPKNTQSCSTTTQADGTASCTVYLTADPGSFNVGASFDATNDLDYLSTSSLPQAFTINKAPTVLVYTGDLSQDWNDSTTLSAKLTELDTGAVVPNESVTFTVTNGTSTQTCSGTTNVGGTVSCSFVLTLAPGSYTVSASFAGDVDYLGNGDSHAYTVNHEESVVVYTGATTGDYSDHVTLSGMLTGDVAGGTPLAGRQLTFTLGSRSCSGTTNSSGVASCSLMIGDIAGSYPVTASFGGDTFYAPSIGSKTFKITPEEDNLSYTGATSGKKGTSATLSARLTTDDGAIVGRTVNFTLGTQTCSGTTNSSGVATCSLTLNQNAGSYTVKASFTSDGFYESDSASTSFSIKNS
jgi:hypothetical protein